LPLIVGQESEPSPDILIFHPDLDDNGQADIKVIYQFIDGHLQANQRERGAK